MTTRVDVEEIETTKSERLLATVLTGFLLTAGLWVYFHIDIEREYLPRPAEATLSASDRSALERRSNAERNLSEATRRVSLRRRALADRREAYRTALEEGRSDPALAERYRAAQAAYGGAQRQRRDAGGAAAAARAAAGPAEDRLRAADEREGNRIDARRSHDGRVSFLRRLALVLLSLGAAYALLGRLRKRRSRWLPTGMAAVASVALLGLVMAIDYLTDYVDVTDVGVLVLSAAGALLTVVAFAALQRYLARRLPERRVRRRECPFCGYPTGDGEHCGGCGRNVVAQCGTCHAPRRVGTRHCGACGAA